MLGSMIIFVVVHPLLPKSGKNQEQKKATRHLSMFCLRSMRSSFLTNQTNSSRSHQGYMVVSTSMPSSSSHRHRQRRQTDKKLVLKSKDRDTPKHVLKECCVALPHPNLRIYPLAIDEEEWKGAKRATQGLRDLLSLYILLVKVIYYLVF